MENHPMHDQYTFSGFSRRGTFLLPLTDDGIFDLFPRLDHLQLMALLVIAAGSDPLSSGTTFADVDSILKSVGNYKQVGQAVTALENAGIIRYDKTKDVYFLAWKPTKPSGRPCNSKKGPR